MEVNRVGNNLNQIARQLNAQRGVISFDRIEKTLTETKRAIEAMKLAFEKR